MMRLLRQFGWHLLLLQRNQLITISVVITLFYTFVFWVLKDWGYLEYLLTVLIYNDPALIGLIFMGASLLLEKDEGVFAVWQIMPVNPHLYLVARLLVLAVIGWACAMGMTLAMLGNAVAWGAFSFSVLSTCWIFGLLGIFMVASSKDILIFMLKCIPTLILMSLPLFNYVQVTDVYWFRFLPIQAPLDLLVYAYQGQQPPWGLAFTYGLTIFWCALLYYFAYRHFYRTILKAG